jgi:hypothetical protein
VAHEIFDSHEAVHHTAAHLPPDETKRLPRYPTMPAVRIGRLAVDAAAQPRTWFLPLATAQKVFLEKETD